MTTYYVSATGSDTSSGLSTSTAFATLGRAISVMGSSSAGDTTYVLDGTYYLNGTSLSMTSANSNDTIAAYQNANVVVSGGSSVSASGWTVGSDGIWSIHLNSSQVEQLTVDGARMTEARYPNEVPTDSIEGGWLWAKSLPSGDASMQMAYNKSDFSSGQPTVGEKVTVFSENGYANDVLTIAKVDTASGVITFDQPATYDIGPGSRYFVSSSKVLLDQPGEWYFNEATQTLYLKPPAGFDGSGAVVSSDLSLLKISNAQNVTIKGLTFSDAGTAMETDDITTAAINVSNSNGVVLDGNKFLNVAEGVRFSGNSHHNTVSNSDFQHIWSMAVDLQPGTHENLITNNTIQNSGEVFTQSGSISMGESWGNTISHNSIQNVPRFGISDINWDPSTKSGANIIEYNTILHSGQKTSDVGAIYAYAADDSAALGNTIRYNTVVDTGGLDTNASGFASSHQSVGIYMDNMVSNAQIYGNFIKDTGYAGILLHGGNNNDVSGNTIVGSAAAAVRFDVVGNASMAGNKVHGNIIQVSNNGNDTVSGDNPSTVGTSMVYQNIYYSPTGAAPQIRGMSFSKWQASGGDQSSSVTNNPGFVSSTDYSLKSGSYALTHGFTDLPWSQMGATGAGTTGTAPTGTLTAPTITSFSPDSATVGDGITNANVVTLTGTAAANSVVKIFEGSTQVGTVTANAGGSWSYATSALSDGTHSFTAKATDAAGNTSGASATTSVIVDTVAPGAPGIANNAFTDANHVLLTGTAAANSVVKVFEGSTQVGTVTANAGGSWSYATSALSDGTHSFTAKATDAAGNTSGASATTSVIVDTVAPGAPTITSFSPDSATVGDGITNANVVTLTGTAAANSVVKVFEGSTQVGTATANAGGSWSYATSALSDGTHSFTAKATDAAGNTSGASSVKTVMVDTVAPGTPLISSNSFADTNHVLLAGTAAANSVVKVFEGSTQVGTATANAGGSWSYATSALSDGTHSFTAKATDAAGNTSVASASKTMTVSAAVQPAPTITSFSPDSAMVGDGITNTNVITLAGTATASSIVKIFDGSVQIGAATASSSGSWSYATSTLSDGTHSFNATTMDTASKIEATSAVKTVLVDTVAPNAPVISGQKFANVNHVLLNGTAAADSIVKIFDGSTQIGTAIANSSGSWSHTTSTLSDGSHNLTVKAMDAAGNTSVASKSLIAIVETPASLVVQDTSDHVIDQQEQAAVSFTVAGLDADEVAVVKFSDSYNHSVTVHVSANTSATVDLSSLNDGTVQSSMLIMDKQGNVSEAHGNSVQLSTPIAGVSIDGTTQSDTINATQGVGGLHATAGNDTISGRDGNDTISGLSGRDTISGGDGNDKLIGGAGADVLNGGYGNDKFVFPVLSDSLASAPDLITDFRSGVDQFQIGHTVAASDFIAKAVEGTGNLAADIMSALVSFAANGAAKVTISNAADAGTYVVINDASAGYQQDHDAVVKLMGNQTVTNTDFIS